MTKVKVAVITAFYNRGSYMRMTIESLLAQDIDSFCIVVIDDCSVDATGDIIREYEFEEHKVLSFIKNDVNKGFTRSVIDAIASVDAEYIAIQGSGDISHPSRLRLQAEYLDRNPDVSLVGCDYKNTYEETNISRIKKMGVRSKIGMDEVLRRNPFTHGEVMFRKYSYNLAGGYRPEFLYSQDYDLWLRMVKIGKFWSIDSVLYERFIRHDGVTYVPERSIRQARFSIYARRMATSDDDEASKLYLNLQECGIENCVQLNDVELQERIFSNAMRLAYWGNNAGAWNLAHYITNNRKVFFIKILAFLLRSGFAPKLSSFFNRVFGRFF